MTIDTTLPGKGQIRPAAILVYPVVGYINSAGIDAVVIVVAVVGRTAAGIFRGITVVVGVNG
jgi:hypothetical protein